ncbi:glutamine ABC transporter substrate-binding protein [Clostridiaceae bacterium]|nr:glutamine ABC transporter substrate-binding protein [Clostridiaceae bacterium]
MRKKTIALAMSVLMAATLSACGGSGTADTTAATTTAAETTKAAADDTTAATEAEAEADNTDGASGKVYKIATDTTFAPFEFENDKGEMVGIDLDLLKAIAEDQGFEYELVVAGFSAATTGLEAGEYDAVIAGMSITDARKEKYDFSDPYYDSGVGMAVNADSDITSYEDLKGKTVAAKIGTEGCTFAESIADQYGFTIMQFEDSSSMYQDVLAGNSVACFEDYPVLGYEISRGTPFTMPLEMEHGNSYGFAVLKGQNSELLMMFDAGLKNMKDSGKYDEILNTYISK